MQVRFWWEMAQFTTMVPASRKPGYIRTTSFIWGHQVSTSLYCFSQLMFLNKLYNFVVHSMTMCLSLSAYILLVRNRNKLWLHIDIDYSCRDKVWCFKEYLFIYKIVFSSRPVSFQGCSCIGVTRQGQQLSCWETKK